MKHAKKVEVLTDTKGRTINRITTLHDIVIELDRIDYPAIEKTLEQVDMTAQVVEQVLKRLLEKADITITGNKITITFK